MMLLYIEEPESLKETKLSSTTSRLSSFSFVVPALGSSANALEVFSIRSGVGVALSTTGLYSARMVSSES